MDRSFNFSLKIRHEVIQKEKVWKNFNATRFCNKDNFWKKFCHRGMSVKRRVRGVLERKGTVCLVRCMNIMCSSNKSMVVLRSTILGSFANETLALCNNHLLFYRFFCSGTLVKFVLRLLKKITIFVVFLFGWEKMNPEQRISILEKLETEPDPLSGVVTNLKS